MKKVCLLILHILFTVSVIYAQKRSYTTEKIDAHSIKIDGIPDEKSWDKVEWSGGFIQFEPHEGDKPSQNTEFKIVHDHNNIYVAFKVYDDDPDKIEKRLSRRDSWDGDLVVIQFDSYFDKKTAFVFTVNAAGVRTDAVISGDNMNNDDDTWDPIWTTKTVITDFGWSVEMKIPLSQLRFGKKDHQVWGIQLGRYLFRKSEWSVWQHIPKESTAWVSRFGQLVGLKGLTPKRQVEIAPYVSFKQNIYEQEEGNPYADGSDFSYNGGIDGKIGITNDLTLDFAVNPDFGQVEADPSEVNLTAFETFFDEKRPFFVEGNNITDYQITPGGSPWSQDNLFYSRRIGRYPQFDIEDELSENEYSKIPDNTRILGALKLTGKTKKGLSIGIIESLTNNEFAKVDLNGIERKESVEPYTNYFIGRLQKDMYDGNTVLGGMMTSTYRFTDNDRFNFLNRSALTGGLDFQQYFFDKKYFLTASLVGSYISGSEEAMIEQQSSSRRYYQRPDATSFSFDSTRTSLSGIGGNIHIGKQSNKGLSYGANLSLRSPGLELNDIGYLLRTNALFHFAWINYNITDPVWIFRSIHLEASEFAGWDFSGTNLFYGISTNAWMQFKNLWNLGLNFFTESDNINNFILRGGPSMQTPGNVNFNFHIQSNPTKKLVMMGGISKNKAFDESGKTFDVFGEITYQPFNFFRFSLFSIYNKRNNALQYVESVTFENEDKFIFAQIDQKTFSVTTRIDLNITPDFTIQYYGAPFISAALYSDYKKITHPQAENFNDRFSLFHDDQLAYLEEDNILGISEGLNGDHDYFIDYPDFNYQQFRSNLVLRWEYKPGSVLFLVWSQDKTDDYSDGTFNLGNDIKNMFQISSNDVFLIKFSYRLIL